MTVRFEGGANSSIFNSWLAICLTSLFWFTSYKATRWSLPQRQPEFCCRIVAFAHGVVAGLIGVKQCFVGEETPFLHPEWPTSSVQSLLLALSLGFFIHDLGWCLYHNSETRLMICHHIYSIIALYRLLGRDTYGALSTCGLGGMELTNPLLQARWFIRTMGFHPSRLFNVTETIFFIMFFSIRIIIGALQIFNVTFHSGIDWEFMFLCYVIYILSCMFLFSILKYMTLKYFKTQDKLQSNVIFTSKGSAVADGRPQGTG